MGTVTINGFVKKNSAFDPSAIAKRYLELHKIKVSDKWEVEYPFNG